MKKNPTLAEAVHGNKALGYEYIIENGEFIGASFTAANEEFFIPADWGEE